MLVDYGNYEFELKKPSPFRSAIFAPLFMRYNDEVRGVRYDIIEYLRKMLEITNKTKEQEEQFSKKLEEYNREKERALAIFFSRIDKYIQELLMKFICTDVLAYWNLDMPINEENLSKLPPSVFLHLFEQVGVFVLSGDAEAINFLPKRSLESQKDQTQTT